MNAFMQTLRNMGPARLAAMGGVAVLLLGFFIFLMSRLGGGAAEMTLLYGDLNPSDQTQITNQLQVLGVPYEIRNNNQIFVPQADVSRARMTLAEEGLPASGTMGYELFDQGDGLTTTTFVQQVNQLRALEGELARSISSIKNVRSARVHLVMPKRELFSREQQQPSASVMVQMRGNSTLAQGEVQAILQLVAAAVPNLKPSNISVVDTRGQLLSPGVEGEGEAAVARRSEEIRRAEEGRLARRIEQALSSSVGPGNVRAEVNLDMNFDKITEQIEAYNPEQQVLKLSTVEETEQQSRDVETEQPVTVAENLPQAQANEAAGNLMRSTQETRTAEHQEYEVGRTVRTVVREAGQVERVTVAVLVDGSYQTDADGNQVYQPRTAEEMATYEAVVQNIIGYDDLRGDAVEVVNLRFAPLDDELAPMEEAIFLGLRKEDLLQIAELLVIGLVAVLVLLLVVRPLLSRVLESLPEAAKAAGEAGRLEAEERAALAGPPAPPVEVPTMEEEEEDLESMIDIQHIEGRVKASSLKKIGEIIDRHPEEAVAIMRNWMYQE